VKTSIKIPGRTENGELLLNAHQQERRNQWLNDMKQSNVTETLEKERKPKSLNQLGYIFGCIIDTVKRSLDDRGEDVMGSPYTEEQIKKVLYFQHHVKHGGSKEDFHKYKTLSEHDDMAKTSDFIDSCLHWLASGPWRIFVPLPEQRPWTDNSATDGLKGE